MFTAILARLPIWLDDLIHSHRLGPLIFIFVLAILGGLIALYVISLILTRGRRQCEACDAPKGLQDLDTKDRQTQEAVLSYFQEIEDRTLSVDEVTVCNKCRRVFDDHVFRFRQVWANDDTAVGMMYTCKNCGHMMHDPIRGPFVCPICETVHCWATHEGSGYVFLTTDLPEEVQDAARGKA